LPFNIGASAAGVPDLLACINGAFYAFEIKNATGKVTELQQVKLEKIRKAGGKAYVIHSLEELKGYIK
jgi:Holliday junction resolvase